MEKLDIAVRAGPFQYSAESPSVEEAWPIAIMFDAFFHGITFLYSPEGPAVEEAWPLIVDFGASFSIARFAVP